jgi:hypothetical protein
MQGRSGAGGYRPSAKADRCNAYGARRAVIVNQDVFAENREGVHCGVES